MNLKSKIYVAGHRGLVGSAIINELKKKGFKKIIIANRKQLDLTNQVEVLKFLKKTKPNFIFIAAAKVGGIYSNNKYKGQFIYENLMIQSNLIHSAFLCKIKNLIFLGSSCIYPKKSKQPIKEEYLLTGKLEETNDAYAIAKIAGIKLCESYNLQYKTNYTCLMPTNTFGPNDNYDELNSHFFPALIRKIHKLKNSKRNSLVLWGNGKAKREVVHVDDIANACVYFMNKKKKPTLINIGTGKDFTIEYYAKLIAKTILPQKKINIKYDLTKPNGIKRKVMDISLAKKFGWKNKIDIKKSILDTYLSFKREIREVQ